jgi:hypothetical protein
LFDSFLQTWTEFAVVVKERSTRSLPTERHALAACQSTRRLGYKSKELGAIRMPGLVDERQSLVNPESL